MEKNRRIRALEGPTILDRVRLPGKRSFNVIHTVETSLDSLAHSLRLLRRIGEFCEKAI